MKTETKKAIIAAAFEPIEKKIFESTAPIFLVTKNYEILNLKSGAVVLDTRNCDVEATWKIFSVLYQEPNQFFPMDEEPGVNTFMQRLFTLKYFLERSSHLTNNNKGLISAVRTIIIALSNLEVHSIKIEFSPLRLLVDKNELRSKKLSKPQVRVIFAGFCHQREINKQELFEAIAEAKQNYL